MILQPTAKKQGCKGKEKIKERETLWEVGQNKLCKNNQIPNTNMLDGKGCNIVLGPEQRRREKEVVAGANNNAIEMIALTEDQKSDNNYRVA